MRQGRNIRQRKELGVHAYLGPGFLDIFRLTA